MPNIADGGGVTGYTLTVLDGGGVIVPTVQDTTDDPATGGEQEHPHG